MPPRRPRRALVALCAAAACSAALAVPGLASAAPVTDSYAASLASGSAYIGGYHIGASDPLGIATYNINVSTHATWTGSLSNIVGWHSEDVRQGSPLTVAATSPLQSGKLHVSWTLTGILRRFGTDHKVDTTFSTDATCQPRLIGGAYDCTAVDSYVLFVQEGLPGSAYVKMVFHARFTITPEGAIATRTFAVNGSPVGSTAPIGLSLVPKSETLTVPCVPVGAPATYRLSAMHWTPAVTARQQPELQIGFTDPVVGEVLLPPVYDFPYGPIVTTHPAFDLAGSGHTTSLGPVLANTVAPAIGSLGPFAGKVGVPVQFSAATTQRCAISSYVWKFSDGTTSYGPSPQRTFQQAGTLDGELTVTDASGLKAMRSFAVTISK